jgi:hypothetical protein
MHRHWQVNALPRHHAGQTAVLSNQVSGGLLLGSWSYASRRTASGAVTRHQCHHRNADPVDGYQIGNQCPSLNANERPAVIWHQIRTNCIQLVSVMYDTGTVPRALPVSACNDSGLENNVSNSACFVLSLLGAARVLAIVGARSCTLWRQCLLTVWQGLRGLALVAPFLIG